MNEENVIETVSRIIESTNEQMQTMGDQLTFLYDTCLTLTARVDELESAVKKIKHKLRQINETITHTSNG